MNRSRETYGPDRAFVTLDDTLAESAGISMPLATADLGAALFVWEFATAVTGSMLGINAFDQPDVEAAKRAAKEALGATQREWPDDDPGALFEGIAPGELACLLAFAPRTTHNDGVMKAARAKLLTTTGVATSAGWGPRYLHSTGQLHKGGPGPVRALVVLDRSGGDVPIPGAEHGFARLIAAQAAGDADALTDAGRTVARCGWDTFERWATS